MTIHSYEKDGLEVDFDFAGYKEFGAKVELSHKNLLNYEKGSVLIKNPEPSDPMSGPFPDDIKINFYKAVVEDKKTSEISVFTEFDILNSSFKRPGALYQSEWPVSQSYTELPRDYSGESDRKSRIKAALDDEKNSFYKVLSEASANIGSDEWRGKLVELACRVMEHEVTEFLKKKLEYTMQAQERPADKFLKAAEEVAATPKKAKTEEKSAAQDKKTSGKKQHNKKDKGIAKEKVAAEDTKVTAARERVAIKNDKKNLQSDISTACYGTQAKVDGLSAERKKAAFAAMKEKIGENTKTAEDNLVGMCRIYVSKSNTTEEKAGYFKELHKIRKSGKTNAEKREKAHMFERVLALNSDLAKNEALQGLAMIDYGAIGIKPTERGFKRSSDEHSK